MSIRPRVYSDPARYAKECAQGHGIDQPSAWGAAEPVDLIEPHDPLDEVVTTLLYRASQAPIGKILAVVRDWTEKQKQDTLEVAFQQTRPVRRIDQGIPGGYALIFDVMMDIGGWRDMHRHRRCQQVQQNFTTVHGFDTPPMLIDAA